jgi:hypothetical protein
VFCTKIYRRMKEFLSMYLCMCIYMYLYAHVFFGLLLCTLFIANEELYRWMFDLELHLLHCLIVMIYALLLWNFSYLFSLSVESKWNPCIKFFDDLHPMSLCWSLTSYKWLSYVDAWSNLDLIPLYFWDCDSVVCVELRLQSL